MFTFFIIYSIVATLLLAVSFRTNRNGSSKDRAIAEELQRSREQVDSVRTELGKCREILAESDNGLSGVIKRLREIAKEVEVLENIVSDSGSA